VRVALACPYALDDPGGVQVHVRELAQYLLDAGHETIVVAPVRRAPPAAYVRRVGRPVDIPYNGSNAPIDPRPWSILAVRRVLDAFEPDVIHAHEPLTPSTGLWATLAGSGRTPVVGTFHSGATASRLYDVTAPVLRLVARRICVRVAVSETAAATARARLGGSYHVVPNGVDSRRFRDIEPADLGPGPRLVFVGRLDRRKGFGVAIQAFAALARDRSGLRLFVVGDGPERSAVDELPASLSSRVVFLGAVDYQALPPLLAGGDVYLGPALRGESFGMVLVEAMAAGVPVVASAIPGYSEVVRDGVDGLLVSPGDPAALAEGVAQVLDRPELAARLRVGGPARAERFDWAVVAAELTDLYREAIAAGPPLR
jgi:phosphatidyl-myo-inositol alpha-mannosyltransferase